MTFQKGHTTSEEIRKKIGLANSIALKGKFCGDKHPMWGKHHTEQSKKLISDKKKGRELSQEHKNNISLGNSGIARPKSEDFRRRVAHTLTGRKLSEATKLKISHQLKLVFSSIEHKKHKSDILKKAWASPEFVEKISTARILAQQKKPTRPEIKLNALLDKHFYGKYKYVGDGKIFIGRKNPDFVDNTEKHIIIELFGTYWHEKEEEELRKEYFKRHGYKTLIIWENELIDEDKIIMKIKEIEGRITW